MCGKFTPTWVRLPPDGKGNTDSISVGIAILSKFPIETCTVVSFGGDEFYCDQEKTFRSMMCVWLKLDTTSLVIGNIHFTWSSDGKPTSL